MTRKHAVTLPDGSVAVDIGHGGRRAVFRPKEDTTMVALFNGEGEFLAHYLYEMAAVKMGISVDSLRGFIERDGYCVVDQPEVYEARKAQS